MTEQDGRTLVVVTGWLNIAVGSLHGLLAIVLLVAGIIAYPRVETFLDEFPEVSGPVNMVVALTVLLVALVLLLSLAEIAAALFLFRHSEYARRSSIGIGICNLLHAPFGTIVGIFTLWVLTRPVVRELFR